MNNSIASLPQPDDVTHKEREDAMGAYLMMFATWVISLPLPVLNLLAAVIYFYVNKGSSRFVAFHALQSLISQTVTTILNVVLLGWLIRILILNNQFDSRFWAYSIFVGLINLIYIIVSLVAMNKAHHGQMFYMPLIGTFVFDRYYGHKATDYNLKIPPNQPPSGR